MPGLLQSQQRTEVDGRVCHAIQFYAFDALQCFSAGSERDSTRDASLTQCHDPAANRNQSAARAGGPGWQLGPDAYSPARQGLEGECAANILSCRVQSSPGGRKADSESWRMT